MLKSCGWVGGVGWGGGGGAHKILVSAQGPFWVFGFGAWGLGLTIFDFGTNQLRETFFDRIIKSKFELISATL